MRLFARFPTAAAAFARTNPTATAAAIAGTTATTGANMPYAGERLLRYSGM
jgi:hypothetical protein